ncbi:solute carrier family 23 member 2-like [Amphiura filiformis]|uniref:solute carrier family 23 member 2-like n=1 Tax=Amphiura filiformis TaxID=82378 RepID=UPI003B214465
MDNETTPTHHTLLSKSASASDLEMVTSKSSKRTVIYGVNERPPLCQSILLGLQHFLTFFGSGIAPPLLLAGPLCMEQDQLAVSQLVSTAFFIEGIITLLQVTFGVRLPIVQGGNMGYLVPVFAYLHTRGDCPVSISANSTIAEKANYTEVWQTRMCEVQGAIIVASCFQVFIGFTGLVGYLLKYIGPDHYCSIDNTSCYRCGCSSSC